MKRIGPRCDPCGTPDKNMNWMGNEFLEYYIMNPNLEVDLKPTTESRIVYVKQLSLASKQWLTKSKFMLKSVKFQ